MYAPPYGYGPGSNSQTTHPNGTPHNPSGQHMMYNPQYGSNPAMGPNNAGGMSMPQNGLAHAGGHMASYQTPYSSSPYGASIPTSSAANLPPNFMPTTSGASPFPVNAPNINPQHMQAQRMQPPPQSSTPTQRVSPYGGVAHTTPPNASNSQSQVNTPQYPNQKQPQTTNINPLNQPGTVVTPQSATFPAGQGAINSGVAMATPLSPGSQVRERERVTLLLEINRELLLEVMHLQAVQLQEKQTDEKKEATASTESPGSTSDMDKAEKEKVSTASQREYFECMRRLQGNLAYLAAIADRSRKPSSQIPAHPTVMGAPPLGSRTKREVSSPSEAKSEKTDEDKKIEHTEVLEHSQYRVEALKDMYKRLQALYPGVDPMHGMQAMPPNISAMARAQAQAKQKQAQVTQVVAQGQGQGQGQGAHTQAGEQISQQKMQTDLYRQHMIQQAQSQAAVVQQNQQHMMQQNQSQNQGHNQ